MSDIQKTSLALQGAVARKLPFLAPEMIQDLKRIIARSFDSLEQVPAFREGDYVKSQNNDFIVYVTQTHGSSGLFSGTVVCISNKCVWKVGDKSNNFMAFFFAKTDLNVTIENTPPFKEGDYVQYVRDYTGKLINTTNKKLIIGVTKINGNRNFSGVVVQAENASHKVGDVSSCWDNHQFAKVNFK